MAYNSTEDSGISVGHAPSSLIDTGTSTAQNIVISPVGMTDIPIPGQGFVTNAIMTQEGSDLILETPDGITIVIENYFSSETPPNLVSPDGKVLTPALVKSFIQASSDFAESETAMADSTPVGEVHEVTGAATVTHADGTKETIVKGTAIYEGDIVETDASGAVNITFADESSFAVSNNAKMAIDEFVYDASNHDGDNKFSVLRGLFVYTSGLIGREDPDDVQINTPVGSIGIRGTIITGFIPGEGSEQPAQISVIEGAIVIHSLDGSNLTLSQQFETVEIDSANGTMTNIGVMPQADMIQTFNVLRTVAPTLFSAMEEAQEEAAPTADQPGETPPADNTQDSQPATPDAPTQQMEYEAPLLNDVIRLNFLQNNLNVMPDTPLVQQSTSTSLNTAPIMPPPDMIAPTDSTVYLSAPTPLPYSPPPPTSSGATTAPVVPANLPPLAHLGSYAALEQAGIAGEAHHFNISRFYSDPELGSLTYTINSVNDPNGALLSINTTSIPGELSFSVQGSMATQNSVVVNISASDGVHSSSSIAFTLNLYPTTGSSGPYTGGDDSVTAFTSNNTFTTREGMDTIDTDPGADGNLIFAGAGDDTITINSNNNKIFGEDGADSINIFSTGNLVSGGAGNDTIYSDVNQFRMYGGTGNDTFTLGAGMDSTSLIDGGTGFDTLALGSGVSLNLGTMAAGSIIDIEKIKSDSTGSSSISLDLTDILEHTSGKFLYLDVDGSDDVTVTNSNGLPGLVQQAGTQMEGSETYNIYTNGSVTLYVNTDAGTGSGLISGL
jgi:hypothetical protein